jgi:hypothetical protein
VSQLQPLGQLSIGIGTYFALKTKILAMMNQLEIPAYLHQAIPEIDNNIQQKDNTPFKLMEVLAHFTADKVRSDDMTTVSRCFRVAENLYERGNGVIKNAVDNVFVYSLTNLLCVRPEKRKYLLSIMPMAIYTLYIHQLRHVGC